VSKLLALLSASLGSTVIVASLVAGMIAGPTQAQASASTQATSTKALSSSTQVRPAADLSQFNPGNIISDEVFFDNTTMSETDVQAFLNGRVPRCSTGGNCLKDYRQSTPSRNADSYCSGYAGAPNESAARIIVKVAASCGINPQVLLVTLQKEQGLVDHTDPSASRYTVAMGQGCPDTAACDTRYYGFFNQVYGAARQFQIYAEGRWFTYYAPGRTWNILYHPDGTRGCGSSPVYIANAATSGLYYYTPYQPNRAALSAGYGEGDRCSSYGNRNFYQYFTDWFGSTQSRASSLAQASGRPEVWLISNGTKHHVRTMQELNILRTRLGAVSSLPPSYLDRLTTGAPASRYVHDPRTGTLYLLDADGGKHRFTDSGQIETFGYPFASYVNLSANILDAFPTGAEVGTFVKAIDTPDVFVLQNGQRRYITETPAYAYAARGVNAFVASVDTAAFNRIPAGPTFFTPNILVKGSSSGDVYLTTPTATLVHIPSFALAAEFGATRYVIVPDAQLTRSTLSRPSLSPVISCDGATFFAAGGAIHPMSVNQTGINVRALSAAECAAIPRGGRDASSPTFIQPRGAAEVYAVTDGVLRHVRTFAQLAAMNGARPLTILSWSQETAAWAGISAPLLADGSFVQFAGRPEIYLVERGQLRHIQQRETLLRLGGGKIPQIENLRADWLRFYSIGAPLA